eukprot:1684501-Rhodomonas_salina.1
MLCPVPTRRMLYGSTLLHAPSHGNPTFGAEKPFKSAPAAIAPASSRGGRRDADLCEWLALAAVRDLEHCTNVSCFPHSLRARAPASLSASFSAAQDAPSRLPLLHCTELFPLSDLCGGAAGRRTPTERKARQRHSHSPSTVRAGGVGAAW